MLLQLNMYAKHQNFADFKIEMMDFLGFLEFRTWNLAALAVKNHKTKKELAQQLRFFFC